MRPYISSGGVLLDGIEQADHLERRPRISVRADGVTQSPLEREGQVVGEVGVELPQSLQADAGQAVFGAAQDGPEAFGLAANITARV
jgi:hypothetical protein